MPYLGLVFNAGVWGLSWWPLRQLQALGLHPLWATMLFFMLGALITGIWQPRAFSILATTRSLWLLALAAGGTNAAFNWAVSEGDVVRVVLLFYLMPLWAVLLAWLMLGERVTRAAMLRVILALGGALLVLQPEQGGWPRFSGLADWLALLGGMGFALNTVLLRQQAALPMSARALAMFLGGLALPALVATVLVAQGRIAPLPALGWPWILGALAMGGLFFCSNMALQYGAARVPVHITSVVMLTEVVFAAISAVWLGGEVLRPHVLAGGGLILMAALMATRDSA